LRRYTDRVVLVLDGDDAGRRRADEILDVLLSEPIDLAIARMPNGVDPCDLLQAQGAAAFEAVIDSACDPLDYRMDEVFSRLQAAGRAGEEAILAGIESVLSALARAGSKGNDGSLSASQRRLREERILARLSRRFGLEVPTLRDRLEDLRERPAAKSARSASGERGDDQTEMTVGQMTAGHMPGGQSPTLPPWDREVLEVLVGVPDSVGVIVREVSAEELESPAGRTVFETARRLHGEGRRVGLVDLLDALPDPMMQNLLVAVDETSSSRSVHDPLERLEHLREAVRRRSALRMAGEHARQLKGSGLDAESEADLLERLVEQRRVAQGMRKVEGMSDPKDG
jgi:DNA primase